MTQISNLTAALAANLAGSAIAPVTDSSGTPTTVKATLAQLRTKFFAGSTGYTATDPIVVGKITYSDLLTSVTALATPAALVATTFNAFASTASGATLMGFGTTGDVTLKNRAGTDVLVVTGNTTGVTLAGTLSLGGASITNIGIHTALSTTASTGTARALRIAGTLVAAANNDDLGEILVAPTFTPGAFTGLTTFGFYINGFSVAGFTSPGNPIGIGVGIITGTGASVAMALQLSPPTGATTNYLIAHTTAATFNVTAAGLGTFGGGTIVPSTANMVISGTAAGATAAGGISFGTTASTRPSTTTDLVWIGGEDYAAGARTLSIYSEAGANVEALVASTHTMKILINGATYRVLLSNA